MKTFLFALLHATSLIRLVGWLNRKKVPILCYHSVTTHRERFHDDPHKLHIPLELFLDHLDYLQRHYLTISLADYVEARRENRPLPDYSVVLTFDDGMRDFFTVAASQLAKRHLPATVFVITDKTRDWLPPDDDTFLSWRDIQDLAGNGIQFGSHTCSHSKLPDLQVDTMRRELSDSRAAILAHITQADVALSYPHGQTSESVNTMVQSLGYSCGVTTTLGPNGNDADLFALKRTVIAGDDDLATFAARLSGLTWWTARLRSFFRKFFPVPKDQEKWEDLQAESGAHWKTEISGPKRPLARPSN